MSCFLPQKLYGVIGWPLAQTLSPLLHNTGFQCLDIPAIYMAWPVAPHDLDNFIKAMQLMNIHGLSVTIPHKIAILGDLAKIGAAASLAGAVNTLYWQEGILCGDNTDVTGFMAPLADYALQNMQILLLGAGGAAHAAAAGLKMAGCKDVAVTSPGNKRQYELGEMFGFTPVQWTERYAWPANFIINATPMGMHGAYMNETPYDFAKNASGEGIAYDLVYNPLQTIFLKDAASAGWRCISGLEMFYGQGNAQFRLWTSHDLPQQAREALINALQAQRKAR